MPIHIRLKLEDLVWGQPIFIKADPDKMPYALEGIVVLPAPEDSKKHTIQFKLKHFLDPEPIYIYDFECSVEAPEIVEGTDEED